MLHPETPYPQVGSFALFVDADLPAIQQRAELVRLMSGRLADGMVKIAFPLRSGASGNKTVRFDDLIDASELSADEARELHDLDRALFGASMRTTKQKRDEARRIALKKRTIWNPIMQRQLARCQAIAA